MKMYMPLCVREAGVVRWHLSEGAALKPGARLATLELDDPSSVTRAEVCDAMWWNGRCHFSSLAPGMTLARKSAEIVYWCLLYHVPCTLYPLVQYCESLYIQ